MNIFNLDIKTYTLEELIKLLKLEKNYNTNDLNNAILNIKQKILSSQTLNPANKQELEIFIDNINNKLINELNSINDTNYNNIGQYDTNHFIIKNQNIGKSVLENNQIINKTIIKKTYNIDSLFRENYSNKDNLSNNFTLDLPETVNNAITMTISSIEIPITYHNISPIYNNNAFIIETSIGTNKTSYLVELLPGLYYTRKNASTQIINAGYDFRLAVNEALSISKKLPDLDIININDITRINVNSFNIIYKIEEHTGFSYFDISKNNIDLNIRINFDINNRLSSENGQTDTEENMCENTPDLFFQNKWFQRLGWMMGYRVPSQELVNITVDKINNLSLAPCHINYPRYIYICIEDFQSNAKNYFSIASESVIAPNIITRINILSLLESKGAYRSGSEPMDYINNHKHIREYFGPTNIKKLRIKLIDEFGRSFSLNYMDWSFLLTFECYYN
jgi:hypothetical protein